MKLAVVGSRTFSDYAWLEQCLLGSFRVDDIEAVISGGARGADALAARFASVHGIPLKVIRADWDTHGKKAGPIRNTEIVEKADAVAAFWDGHSSGTRDTISKARASGRRVVVFPLGPIPVQPSSESSGSEGVLPLPAGRRRAESRELLLFSDVLFPGER